MSNEKVAVELRRDEALVLFDWLGKRMAGTDDAVERALSALEAQLERQLVEALDPNYDALVRDARARVTLC